MVTGTITSQAAWDAVEGLIKYKVFPPKNVTKEFPNVRTIEDHVLYDYYHASRTYNWILRTFRRNEATGNTEYRDRNLNQIITYRSYLKLIQEVKFGFRELIDVPQAGVITWNNSPIVKPDWI